MKAPVSIHPPVLKTNLRIPLLHRELIPRTVLVDRMDLALDFPLTLITAPAGFGKTTLLSQWISMSKTQDLRERVAWVSLENECDLRRFWIYIITALEEIEPGIGKSTLVLFDSPQPSIHGILRILINVMSDVAKDFVLILDDYHHINDPAIHDTLTFFIDHFPSNLHLVVASRSQLPLLLARWRASNQLHELREDDLRFSPEEVAAFFNDTMGLNLSPQEIIALETRTEGWIAGLQLVALSIQGFDNTSKHSFVSAFTGSQRYILDYLVEEVLEQQTDHTKTFLLATSVLDHLTASLCNSVTGQDNAQAVLEHLERAHLFTIPLDDERRWYRYHHLFKDVLYHQLMQTQTDIVPELHRRAMEWFIHAGRTDDAIRHACAAHEWDRAIKLIEPVIGPAWNRAEIRKIIEWLEKLPSEQLDAHPALSLYYLRALLHGGRLNAADQRLREAEAIQRARLEKSSNADDQLLGTICAFRTTVAAVSSEPIDALKLGREALKRLHPENLDMQAYVLNAMGIAQYLLGNMAEAEQFLAGGSELARKGGVLYPLLAAASFRAETLIVQGQLEQAETILRQALDEVATPQWSTQPWTPAACLICATYGQLLYEWNRLEECECYLNEAIELGQQHAFSRPLWLAYHTLVQVRLAYGDQNGAQTMFQQAQHYQRVHSLPVPSSLIQAKEVRTWLAFGQLEPAEHWALTHDVDEISSSHLIQEFESITLARVYLSRSQPETALTILKPLRLNTESNGHKSHLIEILALTALAEQSSGQAQQSVETLRMALQMSESEGYLRTFVDLGRPMAALLYRMLTLGLFPKYLARLLALFPTEDAIEAAVPSKAMVSNTKSGNKSLIEPLSPRELEVLQLIANGASNDDIAEKLVIATTTAKKHVSNILHKLGADNRTQAVARARGLGLCE